MHLEYPQFIEQLRNPYLDLFFKGLNFFDTTLFFFILIPALWFGKHWKVGLRLFSLILLANLAINSLKAFFAIPRPFIAHPELNLVEVSGYSFPSGGATSSFLFGGLLIFYGKSAFKWPIGLSFWLLVSFSRIYLGVHYPVDILGGWALGAILLLTYIFAFPPMEKKLKKCSQTQLVLFTFFIPLVFTLIYHPLYQLTLIALGLTLGLFFNASIKINPPPSKHAKEAVIRGLIGIFIALICYVLIVKLPSSNLLLVSLLKPFVTGFLICTSASFLCYRYVKNRSL